MLFDSFSNNTGDAAIGIANRQLLESRGVDVDICDPFDVKWSANSPLLIGGGELIRPTGTPFYDAFRVPGRHILHATGVWTDADSLGFVRDYAHVSARSTVEADVLRTTGADVRVMPCSTTSLSSPDLDLPDLPTEEPLVGIHLVPHALRTIDYLLAAVNEIPYRKVFFSFTPYIRDLQFMRSLPLDSPGAIYLDNLAPLELHALMRKLEFVLVSSLHASIFAYTQNVPFVSIAQKKVRYYFADRGLDRFVVDDLRSTQAAVTEIIEDAPDHTSLIAADRQLVSTAFDEYALAYREAQGLADQPWVNGPEGRTTAERMQQDQAAHVLRDRDATIGAQALRLATTDGRYQQALLGVDAERNERADAEAQLATVTSERAALSEELVAATGQLAAVVEDRDRLMDALSRLKKQPVRTVSSYLWRTLLMAARRRRG